MKCPICGNDFLAIPQSELEVINQLFGASLYPYIYHSLGTEYSYCPDDYIAAGEYTNEQIKLLKSRYNDLKKTFNNEALSQIDNHRWARIAEITGFTHEILGQNEVAANAYKHSSDLLDELCAQFIKMRGRAPIGGKGFKIINEPDFENLKRVMSYSQNLKRLALGLYLKENNLTSLSSVIALTDSLISLKSYDAASRLLDDLTSKVSLDPNFKPLLNELNKKLSSLKELDETNPN